MELLNRIKTLTRQYKTRKQLQQLPAHLFDDIALTAETATIELKKNRIITFLRISIRHIIRGN